MSYIFQLPQAGIWADLLLIRNSLAPFLKGVSQAVCLESQPSSITQK
jgi:hypothetical protein